MAWGGDGLGLRARGGCGPSDPGLAVDGRVELVGDDGFGGVLWRGHRTEGTATWRSRGRLRENEQIVCSGGTASGVERGIAAVRCIPHGYVSAVVETTRR
ncbi:unnamed protein product [Cuscuta europaea]|uniref:Uncharacterized protein n=1 Tax=Cuscuta europaea TaxID=41803 RepID=A0A9P1EDN2_CUSEU|nr:unnamed protein product [Cuscuta europaea]